MPTLRPALACVLVGLLAVAVALPAAAGPEPAEARDRALCERVSQSPVSLADAVALVSVEGRTPLAAWFALEDDRLLARVVTAGDLQASHDFREFGGPVSASGWQPLEKARTEPAAVAEAARWQTLLAQIDLPLARGLAASSGARRAGALNQAAFPLSLRPSLRGRRPLFEGFVAVGGVPLRVAHDATTGIVYGEPPAYVRAREGEARKWLGRVLPEPAVEGGRWLNVETPPTFAAWKGQPVLVVLTNFNCELECGPSAETVSKWARGFGKRGLRVVTIYREREEWSPHVTLEAAIARVRKAKTLHPVLIDPDDRYIEGLEPGPVGYPVAYVLGADGLVAWEGASSVAGFEADCEAALEAAVAAAESAAARPPGR